MLRPLNRVQLQGSSVRGIPQARILEWLAISFSRGSSQPRIEPQSGAPALAGGFFTTESLVEPLLREEAFSEK